jgi:hypothetical protein
LFRDFENARTRYDAEKFIHANEKGVAGGGVLDASFYGEIFIPFEYARNMTQESLNLVEHTSPNEVDKHPIMFFQKVK